MDSKLLLQRLHDNAVVPTKGTPGSIGYDLHSVEDMIIPPKTKAMIPTGWAIRVPEGCYGRLAPRSGLSWKHSLDVWAGVLDRDYALEVKVILYNHSDSNYEVKAGDKVAQLILEQAKSAEVEIVDTLPKTERKGGFGSTGY